jgi:hypothetical protein
LRGSSTGEHASERGTESTIVARMCALEAEVATLRATVARIESILADSSGTVTASE